MPRIDLTDRPIAITGASSGIGRATALLCAEAGMPVVVSARREDRLETLVEEIRASGGRAEAVAADVTEDGSGERIVERCREAFGGIYAVFANAGYGYEAAHHESTPDQVRDLFETNVFGSLRLIDAALPTLIEQRSGHVLVCSSCVALMPLPYYGAYTASKAAQHHLASAMRLELSPFGVHVSSVHPVGTKTEFFEKAVQRSGRARFISAEEGPFMQSPGRVASAVVRTLQRPRPEVWTSHLTRIGLGLAGLSPRLRDAGLRAYKRIRSRGDSD